jgi:DNA-binding transcriptional ArsR family regulator
MVSRPHLDGVFRAFADPTRRAMLRSLAAGQRNIRELAAGFRMSFAALSKHVRVLERRAATTQDRGTLPHPSAWNLLKTVNEWLRFYAFLWSRRLDAVEAVLNEEERAAATANRKQGDPR